MEVSFNKKSIFCFNKVYESSFSREESAELVVPDIMPDIFEVIDADGLVVLRSKEISEGRMSISGTINTVILYLPEGEGGTRKLSLNIPFAAGVESDVLNEKCRPVARVSLTGIEARMLNPRKVLARAEIFISLNCYDEDEVEVSNELSPDSPGNLHVLPGSYRISPVIAVREKTFIITNEFQLPASKPEFEEMLKERVELLAEDVKTVGNKIIFKGSAKVNLLYSSRSEEEVASVEFTTAFSQILEMDGISEQTDVEIALMLTGAYFEPLPPSQENRVINVELHVVAQTVCSADMELRFIADTYSNEFNLMLNSRALEVGCIERRMATRETMREIIETPHQIKEVVHVYAIPGEPIVNGKNIKCPFCLKVYFLDETGALKCAEKKAALESTVEIDPDMEISVSHAVCAEIFTATASGGVELRMPMDLELLISSKKSIASISGIEIDEESASPHSRKPSVMVVSALRKNSVWALAKKYCSTPEMIRGANGIEEDMVENGRLLLIPRER